jgi:hypothetical protein
VTNAPIFKAFDCRDVFFFLNCSPFARYGGCENFKGAKKMKVQGLFLLNFKVSR